MAKKNRLPKKIAGVKVPKPLRKSKMLRAMMGNSGGRDVLAHALTAGAAAAAAILIGHREEVTDSAKAASRKGVKAVGTAGEALQAAFSAAMEVVRDSDPPLKSKRSENHFPRQRAPLR
ncbi:hypothetical protein ABIE78_006836 [Sinorhizobium fredii]|uniref:Uncharacterized protein n=1 Tax=Sinorhizobium fredii (strain USDA 257) TaxID=1185652 RepID=I3XCD9_SINF2|nr:MULTISPECIES: hypothetical protein [Sinorhizobium]AFL53545.1 hypothetical protein USDA257_c50120 [Sinorhizobium fredii USDA 257]